ncbi:MAG: hypothetical protein ACC656_00995, partial [Candidatus Heimdallarchaeota archaeon]
MTEPEHITREVFRNVPLPFLVLFYLIAAAELIVFFYGFYRLFSKYRKGRKEGIKRTDNILKRLITPFLGGWQSDHEIEKEDKPTHVAHSMVLYGMIILFIGTVVLTFENDVIGIIAPQYKFFFGTFYLIYSFLMDIAGVAVIVGLVHLSRRRQKGPPRLDYKRADG